MRLFIESLDQDIRQFRTLTQHLEAQQRAILDRDTKAMDQLNPRIETLASDLAASAYRRSVLLKKHHMPLSREGISQLFSKARPQLQHKVLQCWDELTLIHEQCRAINERNGRLLSLQQQTINKILNGGQTQMSAGYTADGHDMSDNSSLSLARA
ncbi:flagellar protein FlgN [Spongorhabdus nitratireducens]